ncbi:hypothetical protein D3C75_938310 [compost metagenome]
MKLHQDDVDDPVIDGERCGYNPGNNNPGQEVRQVGNGLHHSLPEHLADLVQQQSKDNCSDESQNQVDNPHRQRIAQHTEEIIVGKQEFELLEAHPFLLTEGTARPVILKSHGPAPHRNIGKKNNIQQ